MIIENLLGLELDISNSFDAIKLKAASPVAEQKTTPSLSEEIEQQQAAEKQQAEEKQQGSSEHLNVESIQQLLESINKFIPLVNTNLVFEFDDLNDPPIIKVIDKESKELIREIPSRDLDKVSKAFGEMVDTLNKSGALFNTEI